MLIWEYFEAEDVWKARDGYHLRKVRPRTWVAYLGEERISRPSCWNKARRAAQMHEAAEAEAANPLAQ